MTLFLKWYPLLTAGALLQVLGMRNYYQANFELIAVVLKHGHGSVRAITVLCQWQVIVLLHLHVIVPDRDRIPFIVPPSEDIRFERTPLWPRTAALRASKVWELGSRISSASFQHLVGGSDADIREV
ncbi:hypothetical protein EDB83DRAFT_2340605 [Lactarius deliciosus]|nr:hypothetical protein EDB83DRAFT_2340605 [Lactarius deliciosus]